MSALQQLLVTGVGRRVAEGLLSTVRFRVVNGEVYQGFRDRREPVILSLWHGRLLPLTFHLRDQGITGLVSQSTDGEYIARVVEAWGFRTVRGSTTRGGGEALRAMVREARSNTVAITPDGPRGPRQRLQHGVITLAHLADCPILPLTCGCPRAWWPGTWDRFCVPKPFSEVTVRFGEPYRVAREATRDQLEEDRVEVERRMNQLVEEADRDGGPTR